MTSDSNFPQRFTKIDDLTRTDHSYLTEDDACYFIGEYTARRGYAYSRTNQLISNFKKTMDRRDLREWKYKGKAIRKAATAFGTALGADALDRATFVPVPPSKARDNPLYDDRLTQMLQAIRPDPLLDIRELIIQTYCGHCGSCETSVVPSATPMPYWCKSCRSYFSVRTGTSMEKSRLPMRKWAFATYLYVTHLKGVSSMKLHCDLNVTQKTAWFMLHRLRDAWSAAGLDQFTGPVEADETYIGGKRKNMSNVRRKELVDTGRGSVGKEAIAGVKDRASNRVRARVVQNTDKDTLQGFVVENTTEDATSTPMRPRLTRGCPEITRP